MARKKKPFVVIPMKYTDVYDMKTFVSKYCPNMKTSTCGQGINWNNIRWVQVRKSSQDSIFLNYIFSEENFMEIKVSLKTRKTSNKKVLQAAYKENIPISAAKRDLIQLCDKGIIPEEFHTYYNSLPAKAGAIERVPLEVMNQIMQMNNCIKLSLNIVISVDLNINSCLELNLG